LIVARPAQKRRGLADRYADKSHEIGAPAQVDFQAAANLNSVLEVDQLVSVSAKQRQSSTNRELPATGDCAARGSCLNRRVAADKQISVETYLVLPAELLPLVNAQIRSDMAFRDVK